MSRFTLLLLLIAILMCAGCGGSRSSVPRITAPAPGTAIINVHYFHSRRTASDFTLSDISGKLTGALASETVCQILVKPGKHMVMAGGKKVQSAVEVDASPNKIYDVTVDYDRSGLGNWFGWSTLPVKLTPVGAVGPERVEVQESEAKDRASPIILDRTTTPPNPTMQALSTELTQGSKKTLLQVMPSDQYRR